MQGLLSAGPVSRAAAARMGAWSRQGCDLGTPVLLKQRDEVDQSNKDGSCVVAIGLFNVQKYPYEQEHIFGE